MVQMPSDTSKIISPDAQMQVYLTAKCFIFTESDWYETVLKENHSKSELLFQMQLLLGGGFWSRRPLEVFSNLIYPVILQSYENFFCNRLTWVTNSVYSVVFLIG